MNCFLTSAMVCALIGCSNTYCQDSKTDPEASPKTEKPALKYRVGMKYSEAKALMRKDYEPKVSAALLSETTKEQRKIEERYMVFVEDEGLKLYFNWDWELVRIRAVKEK